MSTAGPPPKASPGNYLPDVPPEYRDGIWIILNNGEEDTTVRKVKIPEHILREARGEPAETPNGQPESVPVGSALATAGGSTPPADQAGETGKRAAQVHRQTAETTIDLRLDLDGAGKADVVTGVGFFDHMLTLLAKHSLIDLTVHAAGDLHVDAHHTVEDVGICLGKALAQALGDKAGIRRYGSLALPMDEALVTAAVDLSGRPFCAWNVELPPERLGAFNAPLAEEFWRAVASSGALNLHVLCHYGKNTHHVIEAVFKACARALRQAVERDPRMPGVPSTKGTL